MSQTGASNPHMPGHCRTLTPDQHNITPEDISDNAMFALETLRENGFQAYLVGGSVRDLLLGKCPKDFDIATDATPEEVKSLFDRSRIVGRRFLIVHLYFGREVIEVTTFRGAHQDSSHTSKDGMLLRDNQFGSLEEDAVRRDFTVNALYYCPKEEVIHDFTNGLEDINNRQIAVIGDPDDRYREDPVRILRALRLAAKLDFTLEQQTLEKISTTRQLLKEIPPARLFDEFLKLFLSGHAVDTRELLDQHGIFAILFPQLAPYLDDDHPQHTFWQAFIRNALENTDQRIHDGKRVTPAFLLATFLWPDFQTEMDYLQQSHQLSVMQAVYEAAENTTRQCTQRISIPRRFSTPMKDIWILQFRLAYRQGKRAEKLFSHQRFRAAYDFVLLRESAGEKLDGLGDWWTRWQDADQKERRSMTQALDGNDGRKKKPRRRKPRRNPNGNC
jgi:poly(A) polymerase